MLGNGIGAAAQLMAMREGAEEVQLRTSIGGAIGLPADLGQQYLLTPHCLQTSVKTKRSIPDPNDSRAAFTKSGVESSLSAASKSIYYLSASRPRDQSRHHEPGKV